MKSDNALRKRVAKLAQRGSDPSIHETVTVSVVLDVVGDLSLYEIKRLVDLAVDDRGAAILAAAIPNASVRRSS